MQNILYLFNLINFLIIVIFIRFLLYIYYKKMESIYYLICSIC